MALLPVTHADILAAEARIRPYVAPTPLEAAPDLGPQVWLKLENLNPTHSFKLRGALNAVLSLDTEARARGLVTASSGNHAQGLAYAAHLVGAQARILMPTHTPRRKVEGVRRWGAQAVLFGETYDATETEARRLERDEGLTYVSPYNDARVIAGAGSIGLEIAAQRPDAARVLVCVGGGGLIAGIGAALKATHPDAQLIGVNALSAPSMHNALTGTQHPERWDTLAEALSGRIEDGSITLPMARALIDAILLVDEDAIAEAMRWAVDVQGWLVEGGGAVGIAALRRGLVPADDRPTVIVVSGGNLDGTTLRRVLRG